MSVITPAFRAGIFCIILLIDGCEEIAVAFDKENRCYYRFCGGIFYAGEVGEMAALLSLKLIEKIELNVLIFLDDQPRYFYEYLNKVSQDFM